MDLWSLKGFPGGSDDRETACSAGDLDSIPGSGRSPAERNGNPLQYSCLENSMDRGARQATVRGVAESDMTEQLKHTHTHTYTNAKCSLLVHHLPLSCLSLLLVDRTSVFFILGPRETAVEETDQGSPSWSRVSLPQIIAWDTWRKGGASGAPRPGLNLATKGSSWPGPGQILGKGRGSHT